MALERKEQQSGSTPDPEAPLRWWTAFEAQRHREWMAQELHPVPFEALRWNELQWAGQPVVLTTDGHRHRGWLRLDGCGFQRWMRPGTGGGIDPCELTFRDPRSEDLWGDTYILQLGLALLTAYKNPADSGYQWLAGVDAESDLGELLQDALEELATPRRLPAGSVAPHVPPTPEARRAWTLREVQAMQAQAAGLDGTVEPVSRG